VILLDIRMPGIDGIEAARQVRGENGPRVILLTTYDDDDLVLRGMQAGAAGYLLKDQPAEEIVEAIRSVSRGQAIFRTSGAGRVLVRITEAASTLPVSTSGIDGLTARESEVLRLIAEGLSNRQIAAHLVIAEATVKTHVNNIFGKLGFQDRAQAVAHAFRAGLIKS
jgi:DNA-binding NarL/FixJ family response regulator